MSAGIYKGTLHKVVMLACVVMVLVGSYSLDATLALRDRGNGYKGLGDVNRRRAEISVSRLYDATASTLRCTAQARVGRSHTAGFSRRCYDVPVRYGDPFYRWSIIGEEDVIADPATGRVLRVID